MRRGIFVIALLWAMQMLFAAGAYAQDTPAAAPDSTPAEVDADGASADDAIAATVAASPETEASAKTENVDSTEGKVDAAEIEGGKAPSTGRVVPADGKQKVAAGGSAQPVVKEDGAKSAASNVPISLGLSPGMPDVSIVLGGVKPVFDGGTADSQAWAFNFHGMIYVPLRFGIGSRENPGTDQKATVFHAPPRVPGDYETFGYTSTVPNPWTQLNFSYGNANVAANVVIAARTVSSANGYYNPTDMLGINDAYLTFMGAPSDAFRWQLHLGAFANRYGNMGEFDLGRYNTPAIARVNGTGLTGAGWYRINEKLTLMAEAGYQGQFAKAPVGVEPAGWNGFADPNVGSSYAAHVHGGLNVNRRFELGGHFIRAFTRDDRATTDDVPDGNLMVGAVDVRMTMKRFGHLYAGFARTKATDAEVVSNVVRVMNTPGGKGLTDEYLGPDSGGNGALSTAALQYDLSLGNLLRYPSGFQGNAPDLVLSVFSMYTHVKSDDDAFNGEDKLKIGGELGWQIAKWFTLGGRYDIVFPTLGNNARNHEIVTGRLIFHSDWNSRDQVVLQYSHFRTGSESAVREGYPAEDDLTIVPDDHVLSLLASIWW